MAAQHFDIRDLEAVDRGLAFVLEANTSVVHTATPLDVINRVLALQKHRNALETVGQLGRDRRQVDTPDLLEIGELSDLHAVEQHLPANTPRAKGW